MTNATINDITPLDTLNHMKERISRMETKLAEIESAEAPSRYKLIGLSDDAYMKRTINGYNFSGDASDGLRFNASEAPRILAQLGSDYLDAKVYDETTALHLNMARLRETIRWMENLISGQAPDA